MNFLAHGYAKIDRPWALAGSALPDLSRACGVRLTEAAMRGAPARDDIEAEVAEAVRAHWAEDRAFHASDAFQVTARELSRRVRASGDGRPRFRASFFAHVLVEVLLDAEIERRTPGLIDDYYGALREVETARLEAIALRWADAESGELGAFVERFIEVEFLREYAADEGVFSVLGRVATRAGLPRPPLSVGRVIPFARDLVADRAAEMLAAVN